MKIRPLLGEMLLSRGLVTVGDIEQAILLQKESRERLGMLLIRRGALSEDALLPVLQEQLGFEISELAELYELRTETESALAHYNLSTAWCRQYSVVFWQRDDAVYVAARDPLRSLVREILQSIFLGKKIVWKLARARDIERTLNDIEAGKKVYRSNDTRHLKELAEEVPVIELVNGIFARATDARASDIHIEPEEHGFAVRLRIDGVLHTLEEFSRDKFDATVSRLKLISELDIAERRLPQDGRFSMRAGGVESDVRVSVMPGVWGESVVMRLLPKEQGKKFSLDALGMQNDHRALFEAWIHEPHGIVLVTGPTGSGKSTTLYTALSIANDRTSKIISVEDPVEFKLGGVTQIQIQSEIGYTFSSALRSILRHDPDIIMIGEMRDLETAQIAVQASLTGHMVFSTLHTNDAASAFNRLVDMGVEPFLVASSLRGVVAQRLVRRLCDECSESIPADELTLLMKQSVKPEWGALYGNSDWHRAKGCARCNHTGYRGRVGIYEFLPVDESLQAAILHNQVSVSNLSEGVRAMYRSLQEDGLIKAYQGITTVEEVLRVSGTTALQAD